MTITIFLQNFCMTICSVFFSKTNFKKFLFLPFIFRLVLRFILLNIVKALIIYHWLMLSAAQCDHILNVLFTKDHYVKVTSYYRYHSVNVITIRMTKSDQIKNLLYYLCLLFGNFSSWRSLFCVDWINGKRD